MKAVWINLIVVVVWSATLAFIDHKFLPPLQQQHQSSQYPAVTGTVLTADLQSVRQGKKMVQQLRLRYTYEVGGRKYIGDRLRYDTWMSEADQQELTRFPSAHPPGSNITVYYPAQDPEAAVIKAGLQLEDTRAVLLFLALHELWLGSCLNWLGLFYRGLTYKDTGGLPVTITGRQARLRFSSYNLPAQLVSLSAFGHLATLYVVSWLWTVSPLNWLAYAPGLAFGAGLALFTAWAQAGQEVTLDSSGLMISRYLPPTEDGRPPLSGPGVLPLLMTRLRQARPKRVKSEDILAVEPENLLGTTGALAIWGVAVRWRDEEGEGKSTIGTGMTRQDADRLTAWLKRKLEVK